MKSIIFCILLAGSFSVQADDAKTAIVPKKSYGNYTIRGCCYKGQYIAEGKTLRVSGCVTCTCKRGKPNCQVMDCAKPPDGCRYVQTATECCKLVCDKGCYYNGIFIPEGQSKIVAPCRYGHCSGGKVAIAIMDCARPPPNCHYMPTMENCCNLVCDEGCNYNGILIPEGESVLVAPCQYGYCNDGEVSIAVMDCAAPPPNCDYVPTMESCCNLVCNGCNYNGILIPEGESMLVAPCEYGYCHEGEVTISVQECARPPPNCRPMGTPENCCAYVCDGSPGEEQA